MSAKVFSAAVVGLDCQLVEVEADTTPALPGIFIVGLPDKAVDEARERVRSAIKNSGMSVPRTKVTINLAPADLKKVGPAYDLPIAVSILLVSDQLPTPDEFSRQLFIGELALDGTLRPVAGVLSICLEAKQRQITTVFVPYENAAEASLVSGLTIFALVSLEQLIGHIRRTVIMEPFVPTQAVVESVELSGCDMAYIKGQHQAKRALEIAAAGGHNILLVGPPGAGKTMLAKTMSTILPAMTPAESLEVTRIYSVAGMLPAGKPLLHQRPFRSPHHTASAIALVGGGTWPKPGEISLAHRGVLFLDEFPEFPRSVLETLRQPLEDGVIFVSRASGTLQFPAHFILMAAMNPCPCGYINDSDRHCSCLPGDIIKYQKKISGPMLDRIDLHVTVPKVTFERLADDQLAETSAEIRRRVEQARQRQLQRFRHLSIVTNAEMTSRHTKEFCPIDATTLELLKKAVARLGLSARSYFRILKVARTIADVDASDFITTAHVAEALQYRPNIE